MSFHLSCFYRLVASIFLIKILTISYNMCGGLHYTLDDVRESPFEPDENCESNTRGQTSGNVEPPEGRPGNRLGPQDGFASHLNRVKQRIVF